MEFSGKLKKLKQALKKWNKEVFDRVDGDLQVIEEELLELEKNVHQDYSLDMENELLRCNQNRLQYMHREEIMSYQKSRIRWICEGDDNVAIFYASFRFKRKFKPLVNMILEDGIILESGETVPEGVVEFF